MRHLLIYALFIFSVFQLSGQQRIEGTILDEQAEPLAGATVVLLAEVDSSMIAFAIANAEGRFRLDELAVGNYLLQLSYVGYANLEKSVSIKTWSGKMLELEAMQMELSSETLKEVTIKAEHIPMGVRGDTISYNAAAFNTRPGANVEELLKKMPGVEVDRDGSIKAQGEDVENVLVDGKEFFGDDHLIATKNLEAEAIDKVEVFDKKSEIAEFTGVDDGQDEKTINLKLKEDYKKGGFGNITLQGGTEETWKGKLNYNRFNPQLQASVLLSGNNINEQTFSLNEYISFMGGLGNAISNAGGRLSFGNQLGGRDRAIEGINTDFSIGTNLNYDFSKKLQFFSNYFYLRTDGDLWKNIRGNNFSNNSTFENTDSLTSTSSDQNHRLNTKVVYKINPYNELVFRNNFQAIIGIRNNQSNTSYFADKLLSSRTNSLTASNNDQLGFESNLQYKKKFQKKGRNWISSLEYKQADFNETHDILNDFYLMEDTDQLNQFQDYSNAQHNFQFASNYTEPLGKGMYLSMSYRYELSKEQPIKNFFDRVGETELFNDDLSSIYEKIYDYHRPGISLKKNTKKLKLNGGLRLQHTGLEGVLNSGEISINKSFNHLLPSFSMDYDLKSGQSTSANYYTSIIAPGLTQLMPIIDNSNPNITIIGNPELIPEYEHRLNLRYHLFDQFNSINFSTSANFRITQNRIVNQTRINPDFTRELTPINTDQYLALDGYISYFTPIRPLKINARISANTTWATYESFINDQNSEVAESSLNWSLKIDNRKKEKVDVATGVRWAYNFRNYAINTDFNQQFFNFSWYIEGDWNITRTLIFTASYDNTTYSDELFSEQTRYQLLNLQLSQSFAKERITLKLIAHDLLQQNIGLRRYGTFNALQESTYNTLGRYFMAGLSYRLSKRKAPEAAVQFD